MILGKPTNYRPLGFQGPKEPRPWGDDGLAGDPQLSGQYVGGGTLGMIANKPQYIGWEGATENPPMDYGPLPRLPVQGLVSQPYVGGGALGLGAGPPNIAGWQPVFQRPGTVQFGGFGGFGGDEKMSPASSMAVGILLAVGLIVWGSTGFKGL